MDLDKHLEDFAATVTKDIATVKGAPDKVTALDLRLQESFAIFKAKLLAEVSAPVDLFAADLKGLYHKLDLLFQGKSTPAAETALETLAAAIRYDIDQGLTDLQKAAARANLGAVSMAEVVERLKAFGLVPSSIAPIPSTPSLVPSPVSPVVLPVTS